MNKQEAVELLESQKITMPLNEKDKKFNTATDNAITVIKEIDEPEKPVLSKKEAEWVDNLTEFFDTPDALYYITRCGYSGYPFTFDFWGDTYELPIEEDIEYGELNKIRERLVNAVLYDYEVKEEKLYTVELPDPNYPDGHHVALVRNSKGKVYIGYTFNDSWQTFEKHQLTESEIRKDFDWAWQFAKEVKEWHITYT